MLNANSPLTTAMLRGLYLALGTAAAAWLTCYATTDDVKASSITAGIVGLGALGFRSGGEGLYDRHRDQTGDAKSSDVGQPPAQAARRRRKAAADA